MSTDEHADVTPSGPATVLDAIGAMEGGSEAHDYANDLNDKYPWKLLNLLSNTSTQQEFVDGVLELQWNNCPVCARNAPLENLIMDSPQNQEQPGCNHFCCTECWEGIASRTDPNDTQVPCPICRQDVKDYLVSQHPEEMQRTTDEMPTTAPALVSDDTLKVVDTHDEFFLRIRTWANETLQFDIVDTYPEFVFVNPTESPKSRNISSYGQHWIGVHEGGGSWVHDLLVTFDRSGVRIVDTWDHPFRFYPIDMTPTFTLPIGNAVDDDTRTRFEEVTAANRSRSRD